MTIAAFQYLSDNGTVYQVVAPTDFSAILGYVPATGSEPLLPAYISPRYATFQSTQALLWAPVLVPRPFNSSYPPQQIAVSGNIYFLQGTVGEQRLPAINPQVWTISGPPGAAGAQGPAGANGTNGTNGTNADIQTVSGVLSSAQILSLNTSPVTLVAAPGSGKWIQVVTGAFKLIFNSVAYTSGNGLLIKVGSGTPINAGSSLPQATANNWQHLVAVAEIVSTDPTNQPMVATATGNFASGNSTISYSIDYRVTTP